MDFTFGWGKFLGELAAYFATKKLREHSDRYLKLELELKEQLEKPYHERDDVKYVSLIKEMVIVREAFYRDMQLKEK